MSSAVESASSGAARFEPGVLEATPPSVTIIINCYNGADFLAATVESALAQTYADWELVLFDDCSTDDSAAVFRRYVDARLRYVLAERPMNLSEARQAALCHARGTWVAFLDQDDLWRADKLARQMAIAAEDTDGNLGLIYGRATRFGARDAGLDFDHHFEDRDLPEGDIFETLLTVSNFVPMSAAMIRRVAYESIAPVPGHIGLCPDLYFWLALSRHWQARAVQSECCLYRVRSGAFRSPRTVQIYSEFLAIIEHFGGNLSGPVLAQRQRASHTLIGLAQVVNGEPLHGIARILRKGSLRYMCGRALAWLMRELRRPVRKRPV